MDLKIKHVCEEVVDGDIPCMSGHRRDEQIIRIVQPCEQVSDQVIVEERAAGGGEHVGERL